jgi:hypothetical protein
MPVDADFQGCGAGLCCAAGLCANLPGHVPATSMHNKLHTSLPSLSGTSKRAQAPSGYSRWAVYQGGPPPWAGSGYCERLALWQPGSEAASST